MYTIEKPVLENLLEFLREKQEFVFLDTSRADLENTRSFLFFDPVERKICRRSDDPEGYLQELQQSLDNGYYLAGWVGYEFGAILEGKIAVRERPCDGCSGIIADFGVFRKPFIYNHSTGDSNLPRRQESGVLSQKYGVSALRPNMDEEEYLRALEKVQEYIAAGDTYQVNYTLKLFFDFQGSAEKFYLDLRRNQSVAYGAYIRRGEERILSFSPELFFRKSGSQITVRPMKGTAKRGRNGVEEEMFSRQLHDDSKNRSENVMIVDLLRNDLAKLMYGHGRSTVAVDSLFDIESYESLLQMTSTISARATSFEAGDVDIIDLFKALFPCGSITGAPKIRTMEIIDELEKEQRGVYTGAIGYMGPDGTAAFNVPIRTILLRGIRGEMGIGAGITHDSDPRQEWHETLLKGRFLTHPQPDFTLFETILWRSEGSYWLLDFHLDRLAASARFFKFSFDSRAVRERLAEEELLFNGSCNRLRLSLEKDGRVSLEAVACAVPAVTSLPANPAEPVGDGLPEIDFSDRIIDTALPWCFHKTTMRNIYDLEYKSGLAQGLYEMLFCNGKGQITEGCISNIIIFHQGRYLTPPVECGLLAGVMRGKLLDEKDVLLEEGIVTPDMVEEADAIFICNSVRGLIRVRLRQHS